MALNATHEQSARANEETTRVAQVLRRILNLCLLITITMAVIQPVVFGEFPPTYPIYLITFTVMAGLWLTCRLGHIYTAAYTLIFLLGLIVAVASLLTGGVRSPSVGGFPIVMILGALLFRGRIVLWVAGVILTTVLGLYVTEQVGLLPPPGNPDTAAGALTGHFAQLIASAYFLYLIVMSLQRATTRARDKEVEARVSLEQTEQAKRYVDNIIDSLAETLIILDAKGNITQINPATRELLGFSQDELRGKPLATVLVSDRKRSGVAFERLLRDNISHADCRYRTRHGVIIPVLFSSKRVQNADGQLTEIVCTASDITLRKQAEERLVEAKELAEEANMAKSRFLANKSHELRTPLNAVIGYSDMMIEELRDNVSPSEDDLHKVKSAGEHLLGLISDILDLSKIEAGRMELVSEGFSPAATVREVVDQVRPQALRQNNSLELTIQDGIEQMVGDPVRVRQVLLNLLSNAVKFTENGSVRVVARREQRDHKPWLKVSVTDTGIGMSPRQQSRLFQPFRQADPSTSRRYGGTGLGLAISRVFAEMMGGTIDVDSTLGRGSTFTFYAPMSAKHKSKNMSK